jgi:hypothetical protein
LTAPGKANTRWPRPKPTHASGSGGLPLLTLATEVRPRHRFEARLRDRFVADRAYAVRALPHASERCFDRFEESTVAFKQMDLKLRFRIGIGLVNNIALPAARRWHRC